ncbi:hypothetical protein [Streptomyces sp. NPDC057302]|uniref:hypothetical protein n=1 Tax=Streptomyces sp. NPDC057302 TaxID=3346094 RepID=UPI00363B6084
MNGSWVQATSRWALVVAMAVVPSVLSAGAAHADETHSNSHNAPRVSLISTGQIDDPLEDVLEHVLNFGDGYTWN